MKCSCLPPAVAIIDFWEAFVFIRTSNWEWMKSRQVWNPNQNILGWLILSELGGGCFTGCILGMSPLALVERYDDFTLFFFLENEVFSFSAQVLLFLCWGCATLVSGSEKKVLTTGRGSQGQKPCGPCSALPAAFASFPNLLLSQHASVACLHAHASALWISLWSISHHNKCIFHVVTPPSPPH